MNVPRWFGTGLVALSLAVAVPAAAQDGGAAPAGAGIEILDVVSAANNEVHYLDARIAYRFGRVVVEALEEGVPLTFVLDIEIVRERPWLWAERIALLEQRYQISYQVLTRQYMVHNLNIGTRNSYPTLAAALAALGTISGLPLIDVNLLQPDQAYVGRLHARLDTGALPAPLRLMALVSAEWSLASEWREWPL